MKPLNTFRVSVIQFGHSIYTDDVVAYSEKSAINIFLSRPDIATLALGWVQSNTHISATYRP